LNKFLSPKVQNSYFGGGGMANHHPPILNMDWHHWFLIKVIINS